jgi:hexosaminidase
MAASPLLKPAEPRAQQLVDLGTAGEEALTYIDKNEAAPAGWTQSKLALIDGAQKPAGLVRFTVLDPLRDLVKAVQQQPTTASNDSQ